MKPKGLFQKAKHLAIEGGDKEGLARIMHLKQKVFGKADEKKQAEILKELEAYCANPPPPKKRRVEE
jgi:hypothetical protein